MSECNASLCAHSSMRGCPCVCEHAKGFGWSRSTPCPPWVPAWGAKQGGCRLPPAAGRLKGGSSALLQTETSLRNASSRFRSRFAKELGAPLDNWKEAGGFCREPVASRPHQALCLSSQCPLTIPHTSATQKHSWELFTSARVKLFGIDVCVQMEIQ